MLYPRHKPLLVSVGLVLLLSACVQSKKITKGNVFYRLEKQNGNTDILYKYQINKGFDGSITDKGGYITLKPDDTNIIGDNKYVTQTSVPILGAVIGNDALIQQSGDYFFTDTDFDNTKRRKRNKFIYMDSNFMLQTLAIPLKIRPALTDPLLGNTFPQQVETDFNFGFALGWKFNRNSYRSESNFLGLNTNRISVAPGLLFNFGSTALSDKNTYPVQTVERNAFTYSGGLVLMLGFNNVNFGIARGVDYVLGTAKEDWVYQGKSWTGIIIALDLLK